MTDTPISQEAARAMSPERETLDAIYEEIMQPGLFDMRGAMDRLMAIQGLVLDARDKRAAMQDAAE